MTLHNILEQKANDLREKIDTLEKWNDTAKIVELIMTKFSERFEMSLSVGVERFGSLYGILLHTRGVKHLSETSEILIAFKDAGFERIGKMETYPEINRVHWEFKRENVPVVLTAFFDSDDGESNACRFVKVGTKVVDDLKLVCPDSENGTNVTVEGGAE